MCSREKEIFDVLKERLCRSRERHHDIMRRTSSIYIGRPSFLSCRTQTSPRIESRIPHTCCFPESGEARVASGKSKARTTCLVRVRLPQTGAAVPRPRFSSIHLAISSYVVGDRVRTRRRGRVSLFPVLGSLRGVNSRVRFFWVRATAPRSSVASLVFGPLLCILLDEAYYEDW